MPLRDLPSPVAGRGDEAVGGGGAGGGGRLEFWRRLAGAGSKAVSEGLTDAEFRALHVETRLDEYLTARVRDGLSIVLTGNAGDGKTHLARTLRNRLGGDAERFDFAFDATAIMNGEEGVAPIVERWRQASRAGKGMVLAINQYPLYKLRQRLRDALPDVSRQIERQWKARLVTDPGVDVPGGDSLLLVDLSLCNPLSRDFAGRVLDRMLSDPAVREHASSGSDPNFSFNFDRLGSETVKERLFKLFERVISAGRRTTVRELWILIARLLFGVSAVPEAPDVPQAWYSERLFAPDARFPLNEALRSVADPAAVSHPHVDRSLEASRGTRAEEWLGGKAPGRLPASALDPAGEGYLVLGLLAWLMDHLLVTAAVGRARTMLFDFMGEKDGSLLTWFIHKVPNVSARDLQSIGLSRVAASTVEMVKTLDVHHCFYKTLDVPGRFMRAAPFHEVLAEARP